MCVCVCVLQAVEGAVVPLQGRVERFWGTLERAQWSTVDQGLVGAVDSVQGKLSTAFSGTIDFVTGLPQYQPVEEWLRGQNFSWGWYYKFQKWWHQWILWCTPKWEAFEVCAST